MKILFAPLTVLVLFLITHSSYGAGSGFRIEGNSESHPAVETSVPYTDNKHKDRTLLQADLPLVDKEAVVGALPWIIDTLALEKQYRKNDFKIRNYEISPDKRYAIVNISNGALSGTTGPFYRFLVFNPKAKRIFFPSKSMVRSDNLGYPSIAAKFDGHDKLAIAYGYRSIVASIVLLPEGQIMATRELELDDIKEIEKELEHMLEKAQ